MTTLITFRFGMRNSTEEFLACTSDDALIRTAREQLARPVEQRNLHIRGVIQRATQGANLAWSWQHVDSAWQLVAMSMELCDAAPGYVEEHLDDWLGQPFCPWHSYVKREESGG